MSEQGELGRVEPLAIERELRSHLDGCSLVAEIDLDSPVARKAGDALAAVATFAAKRLDRLYPAALCVAMVRHGVANYERNEFWEGFDTWGLPQRQVGQQFLEALRGLGLKRFDAFLAEENARRYVAHALLHGGFPKPCAVRVFRLLAEALREGAEDGEEVVAAWRERPTTMECLPRPAQRFVLQGEDVAVDLVSRMADLLVAAAVGEVEPTSFGLPSHIVAAFVDLSLGDRQVGARRRCPAPSVIIEPGLGSGPAVVLPETRLPSLRQWVVSTGQGRVTQPASAVAQRTVDLYPAQAWSVQAQGPESALRSFEFRGIGKGVYLFSSDGLLIDGKKPVICDEVLVLAPSTFVCRSGSASGEPVKVIEELPNLSGNWHRYSLKCVPTAGLVTLWVGPQQDASALAGRLAGKGHGGATAVVGRPTQRVSLIEDRVAATTWSGGAVMASPPQVQVPPGITGLHRWFVRVTASSGESRQSRLADLPREAGLVSLKPLLGDSAFAGDVLVHGPLGLDLRERLAVVPGMTVQVLPAWTLGPEENGTLIVAWEMYGAQGHERRTIEVPPPGESVELEVAGIEVKVSVPRLLWCLRSQGTVRSVFTNEVMQISADELDQGSVLLMRARPGARVQVRLEDGEADTGVLQEGREATCNSLGLASVGLQQFLDTVRTAPSAVLVLSAEVERIRAPVARVVARYVCHLTSAEAVTDGSTVLIELRFEENRPFRRRVGRFSSLTRPWEGCVEIPIPADARDSTLLEVKDLLPPGRYAVEVGVSSLWGGARPADIAKCCVVQLGTPIEEHKRLVSLDPNAPLTKLEQLLADPPRLVNISSEDARAVASHALLALVYQLAEPGSVVLSAPRNRVLREVLFVVPEAAVEALGHIIEGGDLSPRLLRRAAIALIPDLLDCPARACEEAALERLWEFSPFLGAATDVCQCQQGQPGGRCRWLTFVGWHPCSLQPAAQQTWPGHPQGIEGPILQRRLPDVEKIMDAIGAQLPLAPGGSARALLDWLATHQRVGDEPFALWRSKYSSLNDRRVARGFGEALLAGAAPGGPPPGPGVRPWLWFPQDLLAAALAFTLYPDSSREAALALAAIWEADELVRPLTEVVLLNAIVVYHSERT
jgi:hypothetical protein